jgi:transaldolase
MNYLQWLSQETATTWWHDSADPDEVAQGLAWGAKGVTTNPFLIGVAVEGRRAHWAKQISEIPKDASAQERAVGVTRMVVRSAAELLRPVHEESGGRHGHVCGQFDPALAHDSQAMVSMAEQVRGFAPNVSVKFPATAAGLEALEESCAKGASVTATVSFSVAQVAAAAQRIDRAMGRAAKAGLEPGPAFAVIMIGRVDDYLREIARDRGAQVSEADIRLAGLAVAKKAYRLLRERGSAVKLMVAALRGNYHMTGMAGGDLVMSIHPKVQKQLLEADVPRTQGIDAPVSEEAIERLRTIPDFVRLYDLDGVAERDFLGLGLVQKTLGQFLYGGWSVLEKVR